MDPRLVDEDDVGGTDVLTRGPQPGRTLREAPQARSYRERLRARGLRIVLGAACTESIGLVFGRLSISVA